MFMKHPTQGFIKEIKEDATQVVAQLETHGWFRCQGKSDATPYKKPATKKKAKKS